MRMMRLLSCAALAGCASSTVVEGAPAPQTVRVAGSAAGGIEMGMSPSSVSARSSTVDAPVVEVWRVLPTAYASLDIPFSMVDSTTRVVGNSGFNLRRRLGTIPLVRLIDCGTTQGGPSAETYDIRLSVITQVRAGDAGTTVSTTVDAMGKPAAFSGEYVRCSSTGVLETRIADAVKSRLPR